MATFISVDVEADGPIPGKYSMICVGAVAVEPSLSKTFYGTFRPVSDEWVPEALAISGFTREQCLAFDDPAETIREFADWAVSISRGRPVFISDNPAFDWQFVNWYMHGFLSKNPFGYSARRISDLYCGMRMDCFAKWKHLRETPHDHNPLNDALGNAQALLKMKEMGLKLP